MENKEVVMYIVLNSSLKMKPGKMCSQTGHAVIESYKRTPKNQIFHRWDSSGSAKIVYKADEQTILNLLDKYQQSNNRRRNRSEELPGAFPVFDQGRTQVAEGSLTAIAFQLVPKGSIPELKDLQLM